MSVIDNDADEILPTDFTIQPTFRYTDPLNTAAIVNTERESDEPLFRLTITRFTKLNTTSIGASYTHVLCASSLGIPVTLVVLTKMTSVDGTGFLMFFKHLSQLYQGLGPIDPPPYYEPEAIKFVEPSKTPSLIRDLFNPSTPSLQGKSEEEAMDFVAFRLTATQLTEIRNSVTKGIERPRVTRMDTVV